MNFSLSHCLLDNKRQKFIKNAISQLEMIRQQKILVAHQQ